MYVLAKTISSTGSPLGSEFSPENVCADHDQSGLSRDLFETWCTDKKNGVIIAGYCVEGTLAKELMSEPPEITTMSGQVLPRRCSIDYISFSAHADYEQISEFVNALQPANIVLVHGEHSEMARLKAAILREFEDKGLKDIHVYNPKNCSSVEMHFRGEKVAKVVGSLATVKPDHGDILSGILVKRGFNYHIISPDDLNNYTELATSTITQRQIVPFEGSMLVLQNNLQRISGDVGVSVVQGRTALRVFGSITVLEEKGAVIVEWTSSTAADMFADAVLMVVLETSELQKPFQETLPNREDQELFERRLLELLRNMYGVGHVTICSSTRAIKVEQGDHSAMIDPCSRSVKCDDEGLFQMLSSAVGQLSHAISPFCCYH